MARVRHRVAKSETPTEGGKVNRLSNITVEEVSIVDKPANKRVFLVVKSEDGGGSTPPPPKPPDPPTPAALKISPADKTKMRAMAAALAEKAAAILKMLDASESVEGAATPAEVTKAFAEIETLLGVEVEKSGRKISTQRLEAMRQAHTLLGQVIADADPPEPEPAVVKSAAPPAPPAAAPVVVAPSADVQALKAVTETLGVVVKALGIQKTRIDELTASTGGSRQVPVEKSKDEGTEPEDGVSWPLDMNRPVTRSTTPVEKSFFGQQ